MKLRRFNETNEYNFDYEYVYQCFADLIESDKCEIKKMKFNKMEYAKLTFNLNEAHPTTKIFGQHLSVSDDSFNNYVQFQLKMVEVLRNIAIALDRLNDEYPNYVYEISENDRYKSFKYVIEIYPIKNE